MSQHYSEPKLINVRELASVLGVTPDTIYRLTKQGEIPCYRVGRHVRYDLDQVLAHMSLGAVKEG